MVTVMVMFVVMVFLVRSGHHTDDKSHGPQYLRLKSPHVAGASQGEGLQGNQEAGVQGDHQAGVPGCEQEGRHLQTFCL